MINVNFVSFELNLLTPNIKKQFVYSQMPLESPMWETVWDDLDWVFPDGIVVTTSDIFTDHKMFDRQIVLEITRVLGDKCILWQSAWSELDPDLQLASSEMSKKRGIRWANFVLLSSGA